MTSLAELVVVDGCEARVVDAGGCTRPPHFQQRLAAPSKDSPQ
jgi:hypothetical protein